MGTKTPAVRRRTGVHVTLDTDSLVILDRQAQQRGMSRSAYLRALVAELADDELDRALVEEAERCLDSPDETFIPWEEARRELGL